MSQASESMKQLTKRILKADLASRNKRRIEYTSNMYIKNLFGFSIFLWAFWKTISPHGPNKSVYLQAGDPFVLYTYFLGSSKPIRLTFRPEIYYQDNLQRLKLRGEMFNKSVENNENIKFKAYVWH